ncbi:MAG: nucleoside hydrolase [Candidatus Moraniibacteriota bacterium]
MKKTKNLIPIIIDTDPGHDDALAIMLLDKSNLFDIRAVTTVAGNSTIKNTTNNARYILDLVGSKAPLYSGAKKPLRRKLIKAVVHGDSGLDGAKIIKQEKLNNLAVDKIIEIVRRNQKKISILILGPETNLAKAFLRDPELPKLIKQLVIMGGAINVSGNKNRVAEFNIFVDPEAADIVFRAAVKKILIPLDVCNEVFLTMTDFKKMKGSKLYYPIISMMQKYIQGINQFEKTKGALMYDPLAAYYLINPGAFQTKKMDILIETKSKLTRGMSVADRRIWGEKNYNIEVATKIDKGTFISDFLKILKK